MVIGARERESRRSKQLRVKWAWQNCIGMNVTDAVSLKSSSKGTSMNNFVVCVENGEYQVSLEVWKIYTTMPVTEKEKRSGMLRVIDESGEDYLYPVRFFLPVTGPPETIERLGHLLES